MEIITRTIITIILITTIILPISKNLLSLGTALILTTLLATFVAAMLTNSWFAFIMFLVIITGLLVLFSYIIAIRPNTSYNQKKRFFKIIMAITFLSFPFINTPLKPIKREKRFEQDVQQLFNNRNTPIYWIIGIILLLALLIAVTICFKTAKPLRNYL